MYHTEKKLFWSLNNIQHLCIITRGWGVSMMGFSVFGPVKAVGNVTPVYMFLVIYCLVWHMNEAWGTSDGRVSSRWSFPSSHPGWKVPQCRPVLDKRRQKVDRLKWGQNEVLTLQAVGQEIWRTASSWDVTVCQCVCVWMDRCIVGHSTPCLPSGHRAAPSLSIRAPGGGTLWSFTQTQGL